MKNLKKDLLSIYDLSTEQIWGLISSARKLKKSRYSDKLKNKTIGLIFEKPSTRTMVSFETAMAQSGGVPLVLDTQKLQTKRGESIYDTSKVLSRYLNALVIRAFKHEFVTEFAMHCTIPVINALTDFEHPCQILADLMTIIEKFNIKSVKELKKLKIVFAGDSNNVFNSWLAISAVLGLNFAQLGPKKYFPKKALLKKASEYAKKTKANILISNDVEDVKGANVIYTDVWTSMGNEKEADVRKKDFAKYQVNMNLLKKADKNCIVLHCLPAVRGQEITEDVMALQEKNIFDQAENRLHIQKAIMFALIK